MSVAIDSAARLAELERENAKLRAIRDVLIRRVERSMDLQGSEFALFERATLLEGEVRRRTAQLEQVLEQLRHSNRSLAEAKAQAEAATHSKIRFLAAASHDLLQPLNAARLFLAALAEMPLPGEAARLVESTDIAFDSVERLLGALLDISKLDAGVLQPTITDVPLDPLLRRLAAEFAPVAERKGLRLRAVPTAAVARTDRDMLARALMNLLSNAIRYTRRGGVLVGVRRRGDVLRVVVVDTGVGIPPDRQAEIFQEFRRLEADAEQRDGWQEEAGPTTAPGALLLVIENERAIRDGMQALLEGWGYRVLTAASVEGGLAALRHGRQRPDAVIADYHLDEGTGTEAIAHLRDRFGAAIPAMVITADRMPEVEREIHALRLPLLNKPIRPAQLRACLRHLLEGAA